MIATPDAISKEITAYSYRHLWITDALTAGVDILVVARMAGTSVEMIQKVYGHFRQSVARRALGRLETLWAQQGQPDDPPVEGNDSQTQ